MFREMKCFCFYLNSIHETASGISIDSDWFICIKVVVSLVFSAVFFIIYLTFYRLSFYKIRISINKNSWKKIKNSVVENFCRLYNLLNQNFSIVFREHFCQFLQNFILKISFLLVLYNSKKINYINHQLPITLSLFVDFFV